MYKELVLFRNELKNKQVYKYKLIGITSELLFSKDIFPKNSDISSFLADVFNLEFKNYIMKSRTMIVAKVSKEIATSEDDSIYIRPLYIFIESQIEQLQKEKTFKNAFSSLDKWVK